MKICPRCRRDNDDAAENCHACGAELGIWKKSDLTPFSSRRSSSSDTSFANVASWICVCAAFGIPIIFKSVVFSTCIPLPEDRNSDCGVLLLFVLAQAIAIALGVMSILQVRKNKIGPIFMRSICGIVIGSIGGVIMFVLALFSSIGP